RLGLGLSVAGKRAYAAGHRGDIVAIDVSSGRILWRTRTRAPLSGGTAASGELVLAGSSDGHLFALNPADRAIRWQVRLNGEGLADIDSPVRVSGQDVFTVGFQGRVAMLALETGQIWWSHEASSFRGLTLDDDALYVATADGELLALKARTGTEIWRQKALLHRGLSAPATMDDALVTADFQGYVHWLDKASGALAARVSTGKVRISTAPVVVGNMVLVINDRGHISAFRVTPLAARAARKSVPQTPVPQPTESK